MERRIFFIGCVLFASLFVGCSQKSNDDISYSSQNDQYIQAISPTFIGRLSDIKVSFSENIACLEENIQNSVYFEPKQEGKFRLINENTISFTPNKPYKANSNIMLKVDVNKLLAVDEKLSTYKHPFVVEGSTFDVFFDNLVLNNDEKSYSLKGKIKTDIPVSKQVIEKCLRAKLGSSKLPFLFKTNSLVQELNEWEFELPEIKISDKNQNLKVSYEGKGKKLGLNSFERKSYSGSKRYSIPAFSDFSIIDINTSQKNIISVSFSKALDTAQDISEFIKFFGSNNARIYPKITSTIKNNILSIYNDANFENVANFTLTEGIKSLSGQLAIADRNVSLSEDWDNPAVKFMTDGNILPTTQGTIVPIETKNLSGVLIQAFAVYDFNINQFFQVNEYDSSNDLYRVGEPVWEKNISFEWKDSMQNKYVPRGIDISELLKKYPSGMFQIRVSFRKHNIKYVCNRTHEDFSNLKMPPNTIGGSYKPREKSYWDYSEMNYDERRSYWTYKNDPCHPAFYTESFNSNSVIKRNIFVSDIGLMAKLGSNGRLFVNASDLKTTEPIQNLTVSLYSFVGSKLAEGKTDKAGRIIFENASSAFIVMAKNANQTSYLKIGKGTALSTSHFETGGVVSENGIRGFIYGERGVWRPGDEMYLTFVLQDLNKSLPENIPVVFTLTDPLGHETEKRNLSYSVNGFYPIKTKTQENSTTGLWNANIKIGGKEWNKSLRVESVIPNKLAVDLKTENAYLTSKSNKFTLAGAWLHGAETPNYKADVTVSFTQGSTSFEGYSEYTFANPMGFVDSSKDTIFEGKLGSDSKVTFTKKLEAGNNLPGKLKAHFISRIFEPSGVASTSSTSFDYSPYSRYIGLKLPKGDESRNMLLTDIKHTADVVLLGEDGGKIPSANLDYEIYKLEWKWWWEKDAYTAATYIENRSYARIDRGTVSIKNGKGSFQFEVKYPSWGRYLFLVRDGNNGHVTGKIVYIDWPGWAGRAQEEGSGSTAMLPLAVEKKQYTVNEVAKISFASTKGARALATIEKGGNIIGQRWIETSEGTTTYELPLKDNMAPNVYVHITLLQPHMQTKNSLPIRLYGVVPVLVDNPKTLLQPVITCNEVFTPSNKTTISVSEKNGKPMTYTIAVVDEGLLGLTAFKTPNLRSEFYKKEASLLEHWDLYKYVMNAYSGKLETLLAIGGSEEIIDKSSKDSNRFKPVVKFFGPFILKAGEKRATTFDMPNYIGAVRTMVIAGNEGAYGLAEKTTPVKSDIILLPSVPRTLGISENVKIPVTIFNGTDAKKNINVSMDVSNAFRLSDRKSLTVEASSEAILYFDLPTATAKEGTASFVFKAMSGNLVQTSAMDVKIQSRGIPVSYRTEFTLKGNSSQTVKVATPTEKNSTELTAEVTTLPLLNLSSRLDYLTKYPHGCIEQITSGGFPQLFINDFIKLSSEETERVIQNVNSVIERYPGYQTASGAFSYWTGGNTPHLWGSIYAAHFMTEAKKRGYTVPDTLYQPLINWLADSAQSFIAYSITADDSFQTQVYRLYVLALAGHADIGSMNRVKEYVQNYEGSKFLLASSYVLVGRKEIAKELLSRIPFKEGWYRKLSSITFDSSLRNQGMGLLAYTLTDDGGNAAKYAKSITEILNSDRWLSTQETAWALFTLLPYYENIKSTPSSYSISCNGQNFDKVLESKSDLIKLNPSASSEQTATIQNKSKNVLFGTLSTFGKSVPSTEVAKSDGLSLDVKYQGISARDISAEKIKKGDTFDIKLSISNNTDKDLTNIAVTIPVATAWEYTNDRLSKTRDFSSVFTYQDIRDDFIYTYLDLDRGQSKELIFSVAVSYDGDYYIPAIYAEAMYDNEISAIVPGIYVKH